MTPRPLVFRALVALILLMAAAPVRAQDEQAAETPVRFDYYLLSLSLAPSFCALSPRNRSNPECGSLTEAAFQQTPLTVHGLWPNRVGASVNRQPRSCRGTRFAVSPGVQARLSRFMPGGIRLEKHEWREHGTCSGLSPDAYFGTINQLAEHANASIGDALRRTGMIGGTVRIADLLNAVATEDPVLASAIVVDCRTPRGGGTPVVAEIRVVLTKDFRPMAAKSALLGQNSGCRRGSGHIPDARPG